MLRNNRIRSVDESFQFYHELSHIDLSHNHLVKILPKSFSTQTKLNELHLNNNKITYLSNLTFGGPGSGNREGLPSLAVLNLRENLIENLEPGVFMYSKNLEELDLGQNKIGELGASALRGLGGLRILRLDNNELARVPGVFSNSSRTGRPGPLTMSHLAELFIGMNPIDRLESEAFSGLTSLGVLDLRGCHLNSIDPLAFRGLSILKKLILTDNNLRAVPSTAFPPLKQLEVLRIGRNPINTLGPYTFSSLPKIKVMEMSGAPELVSVDVAAFISNLDLETVEISTAKKLTALPPKLFKGISSIKNLVLRVSSN
jgi:Leucine-rich repeat (LRR) protein